MLAARSMMRIYLKVNVKDVALKSNPSRAKREREAMLDLGGTTTTNIIAVSDFNAEEFVAKDLEIGLNIRNLEIKLEIASNRYNELFTDKQE